MLEKYKEFLREFIKFKSISTDPQYQDDCKSSVEFLKQEFVNRHFQVEIVEGYDNPIIIASYIHNPSLKTVLIYGHYDVQPADISEGWVSDPFDMTEQDEKLIARGIADNKGQVSVHIVNVFDLIEKNELKYNIKFILEGAEEIGSPNMEAFFKDHSNKLKSDIVLISDGELMMGHPIVDIGYRGIIEMTLKVKTSSKDNHSGIYGGTIPNAIDELIKLLAKTRNEKGEVIVSGIVNNYEIDPDILQNNRMIPFFVDGLKKTTGATKFFGEDLDVDFYTLTGYKTALEITGITGGYVGEGYRNAIPGNATAKINFRLAGNMKTQDVINAFTRFIENNKPDYLEYEIKWDSLNEPIVIDYKNEYISEVMNIQKDVYKEDTILLYCGAIIPIAGYFQEYLKVPVISAGLANEDCNMHGVNENFKIEDIEKGLEFSRRFLSK